MILHKVKAKAKYIRKVPAYLVHEEMDGKPLYYKDYKSVLNNSKSIEEIMGSSALQSVIIQYILKVIFSNINDDDFYVLSNEVGSHIDIKNNLSYDIAVFDSKVLTAEKINKKYIDVAPKIVIEVDNEADVTELTEIGYIYKKSHKMLDFGVERIFWVLTEIKSVIIIEKNKDWKVIEWQKDIKLINGISINIQAYLDKKGIIV